MHYRITAPVGYTGLVAGVSFANDHGHTCYPPMGALEFLRRHGFTVVAIDPDPCEGSPPVRTGSPPVRSGTASASAPSLSGRNAPAADLVLVAGVELAPRAYRRLRAAGLLPNEVFDAW